MKYIIYALLLIVSAAQAQVVSRVGVGLNKNSKTGIGFRSTLPPNNNVTVDMWQTFEFTNPTTANLDANDNTSTGAWITNDSSLLISISTSGERALFGTINGSTDTGHTRGLLKSYTANDFAYVQYDLGAGNTKSTISVGAWVKYVGTTLNVDKTLFEVASASTVVASVVIRGNLIGPAKRVGFLNGTDTTTALTSDVFYWVTAQITRNGTCYVKVYDTTGTLVGTEATVTGADQAIRYVSLGKITSDTADNSVLVYWDDFVIDWTDATYPLGP